MIDQIEAGGGNVNIFKGKYLSIDKNDNGINVFDVLDWMPKEASFNLNINKEELQNLDDLTNKKICVFYLNLEIVSCSDKSFSKNNNDYGGFAIGLDEDTVNFTVKGNMNGDVPLMIFVISKDESHLFNPKSVIDLIFLNAGSV